jgi:hypothetical protein
VTDSSRQTWFSVHGIWQERITDDPSYQGPVRPALLG